MTFDLKCKTPFLEYTDDELKRILAIRERTLEQLPDDVKIIKDWLKTQPHIPMLPTDRQIVCFLVMNKFSIEKTKEKLDNNYTIKCLMPEFYSKPPSHPDIQKVLDAMSWAMMPKLSKDLNRVFIWKLENSDDLNVTSMMSCLCMFLELKTQLDFSNSDEYIFDLSNFPLSAVPKFSPMDIKRMLTVVEKVYSNRIGAIHYVNMPLYAETMVNMVKALLKAKIRDRLKLHKSYTDLLDIYGKDVLPKDLGGNGKTLREHSEDMKMLLLDHDEYITKLLNAKVNEDLRPAKLANDELLGFHGNFRKLQVD